MVDDYKTHLPRFETRSSHGISAVLQFTHGISSVALQRTRLALHVLQAFFARDLVRLEEACVGERLVMAGSYRVCAKAVMAGEQVNLLVEW